MALVVDVQSFEGPLDLLLQLIKKNEIQIEDIPIQEITQAYLSVIEDESKIKKEEMGDFIVLASELLYIKSRLLLPYTSEDEEEEDPREALIQRLRAYDAYRRMTRSFAAWEREGSLTFEKPNEDFSFLSAEPVQISRDIVDLCTAMEDVIRKKKSVKASKVKIGRLVEREVFEVEAAMQQLMQFPWKEEERIHRFVPSDTIGEWIAVFIAVLELIKRQWLRVSVRRNVIFLQRRDLHQTKLS